MGRSAMQCKNIPDIDVLRYLATRPNGHASHSCTWYGIPDTKGWDVTEAMPAGTPPKMRLAKMRKLILKGLVEGCACGCYGHFQLSHAGAMVLDNSDREGK